LHLAIYVGAFDCAEALFDFAPNPNATDKAGQVRNMAFPFATPCEAVFAP
jgi:hypothetical protein